MQGPAPEPGFIPAYRFFVAIRILFWLAVGPVLLLLQLAGDPTVAADSVVGARLIRNLSLPSIAPLLFIEFVLLALLAWPKAQRLGRWFVPLTLTLGLIPLLIGYYLWPALNPLQSPFVMFFFVTAVLVAWEYKYRYLYIYVFLLTLYQTLVSPWPDNVPWTVPAGFLVLQAVMMLLVGSVVATMATVQAARARSPRRGLPAPGRRQRASPAICRHAGGTDHHPRTQPSRTRVARHARSLTQRGHPATRSRPVPLVQAAAEGV